MKTTASSGQNQERAFTLVELLVVVAILALLAAMSLPALCKTNGKSRAWICFSNVKTLTAAWTIWSLDNNEQLLSSLAWAGSLDPADPATADFIDLNKKLPAAPLSPYLRGNLKVYQCPDDPVKSTLFRHVGESRALNYSMNTYVGNTWTADYIVYNKMSDVRRPGPSNTFVILDDSSSINDGRFAISMDTYDPNNLPGKAWVDVPGTYHSMSGNVSFADGHAETHKWKDARTLTAIIGTASPNNLDIDWLQSKSSAKITSPTR